MRNRKNISLYMLINILLLLISIAVVIFVIIDNKANNLNIKTEEVAFVNNIPSTPIVRENKIEEEEKVNKQKEISIPIILENTIQSSMQAEEEVNYTSTAYKYYYYQLNTNAKKIYNSIEKNISKLKTGTYTIDVSKEASDVLKQYGTEQLNEDFQSAWDAAIMDRPELFYIDVSKITLNIKTITYGNSVRYEVYMGNGDNSTYLEQGFYSNQDVNRALENIDSVANGIISTLDGSTYNKIKKVHDWLVDNISYSSSVSGNNSYNIYGAFINKSVVCEGYAESFKYIMDKIGVPCIIVTGTAENSEGTIENHEWNYVQIDGKWYAIDVTWDDPIITGGGKLTSESKYKYFLKGSGFINDNHFADGKISSKGIIFTYPKIEEGNY